ncbi:hypothetical protein BGX31_006990 [Mortierella sp. GBA43]|nr:hypothetical protein BGX31_006990 [Mortierella sp. GBA43]
MPNKDKQKRLVIDILNGQPNGPDGSYLFYGVPEGTTLIRGRVFVMDVKQPNKQQRILPGEYEECFEVSLPSTLPSSSQNENARISYIITARLIRKWSLDIVETKEICVAAGRTMRFVSARLGLKQYLTLTSSNGNHSTSRYKRKILDYDLLHWPKHEVPGFHDTVLIQLPMIPDLSPTTETNVCSIRHSINLLVEIAVKGLAGMLKFKGIKVNWNPQVNWLE